MSASDIEVYWEPIPAGSSSEKIIAYEVGRRKVEIIVLQGIFIQGVDINPRMTDSTIRWRSFEYKRRQGWGQRGNILTLKYSACVGAADFSQANLVDEEVCWQLSQPQTQYQGCL